MPRLKVPCDRSSAKDLNPITLDPPGSPVGVEEAEAVNKGPSPWLGEPLQPAPVGAASKEVLHIRAAVVQRLRRNVEVARDEHLPPRRCEGARSNLYRLSERRTRTSVAANPRDPPRRAPATLLATAMFCTARAAKPDSPRPQP